jgi:integrase/recombinase XerD
MKLDRHGKAEPMKFDEYRKIRNGFKSESHKLILDIGYYTGERWGAILRLRVEDVYSDPIARTIHTRYHFSQTH